MNRFNNITKPLMWFMALLLTAFMAGCGGGGSSTPAPIVLSSAKSIDTFSLAWSTGAPGTAPGTIDQTLMTIKVTVPHATLLTPMTATFLHTGDVTVGSVPQVSGSTNNDYTNPVSYKVTAADGSWATYTVIVSRDQTVKSLAVTPATPSIPAGGTQQFAAIATYLDLSTSDMATSATWTADSSGNATVGLHTGLAVGVTKNTIPVVITAVFGGKTATAALTVTAATLTSMTVTPGTASVAVGSTTQFTATGTYSDLSISDVTITAAWTADASGNATVGLNTGVASGVNATVTPVVITATLDGQSAAAQLTVTAPAGPSAVSLGSITTNNFVILATTAITEAGPVNGAITGNIGLSPASGSAIAVTCAEMQGTSKIHASNAAYLGGTAPCAVNTSPVVHQAVLDLGTAYTNASDPATPAGTGANLNLLGGIIPLGTNFAPGVYTWGTAVNINGDITLTGSASDVWIFQISGNLVVAAKGSVSAGVHVILSGGAVASNVFWQVGGASATLGTYSTFNGNILTSPSTLIAIQTGAILHGRALAGTSVALDGNIVGP